MTFFLLLALLPVVAATNHTSDSEPALEVWEIALVSGVGGVALLMCLIASYVFFCRSTSDESVPVDVEAASTPSTASTVSLQTKIMETVTGCPQGPKPEGFAKALPAAWGCPPERALLKKDPKAPAPVLMTLSHGYGKGTKEMFDWVDGRLVDDGKKAYPLLLEKLRKPFPIEWGPVPAAVLTRAKNEAGKNETTLPTCGYGLFVPALAKWIRDKTNDDKKVCEDN